jgi:hypothetical protein
MFASYYALEMGERQGLIAFFNEKVDITVDGGPEKRPRTP